MCAMWEYMTESEAKLIKCILAMLNYFLRF